MRPTQKTDDEVRDSVLQLLSAEEVAHVGADGATAGLADGDEHIDLAAPDNGVRRVHRAMQRTLGKVLGRSVVSAETWAKIEARFGRRFAMNLAK
jgi:hypothetical protein